MGRARCHSPKSPKWPPVSLVSFTPLPSSGLGVTGWCPQTARVRIGAYSPRSQDGGREFASRPGRVTHSAYRLCAGWRGCAYRIWPARRSILLPILPNLLSRLLRKGRRGARSPEPGGVDSAHRFLWPFDATRSRGCENARSARKIATRGRKKRARATNMAIPRALSGARRAQ